MSYDFLKSAIGPRHKSQTFFSIGITCKNCNSRTNLIIDIDCDEQPTYFCKNCGEQISGGEIGRLVHILDDLESQLQRFSTITVNQISVGRNST